MSNTATRNEKEAATTRVGTVDMKLEVVVIPVSDVDRAKRFYEDRLKWRLDADFSGEDFRVVQLTPPGSQCSIHFGKGATTAVPGSVQGLYLVVDDIDEARRELVAKGVDVSEPFHYAGVRGPRLPGVNPERGSYRSYASFSDPDGNGWLLQEIKTRLPGRGLSNDVATLTELLREAEAHHGPYEASAPKHHWSDWYATYIVARQRGRAADDAAQSAARHMERASQ